MNPTLQSYKAAEAAAERILRDLADIEPVAPETAECIARYAGIVRSGALYVIQRTEA